MKSGILTLFAFLTPSTFYCATEPQKDPVTDSKYFMRKISRPADSLVKRAVRGPRRAAKMDFANAFGANG